MSYIDNILFQRSIYSNLQIVLLIFSLLSIFISPQISYGLDSRECPTNYAELTPEHRALLQEVATERGYTSYPDAGKIDAEANTAVDKMITAGNGAGVRLIIVSDYRSYDAQVQTFFAPAGPNIDNPIRQCFTGQSNRVEAKKQYLARGIASAPPGFSEYHTGKAFDFNKTDNSFENDPEFKWLQENAQKYGFQLSYPKGSTQGAGYKPWHWFYVGGESSSSPITNNTPDSASAPDQDPGNGVALGPPPGSGSYISYTNFPGIGRINSLCQLITPLWYLGFIILFTAVIGMFSYGGYMYVTAGVNAGKVNQAKEIFTNTIIGLVLGLSIYIILNIINPGLLTANCRIQSTVNQQQISSGENITPKPGESVFPTTCPYEGPGYLQSFGAPRDGGARIHAGIDFTPPGRISNAEAVECPILAFRDGVVTTAYSGFIAIKHSDGIETRYIHNSKNFVSAGDTVQAGQQIGKQGNVNTFAIHLHFEVYKDGVAIDPKGILLDSSNNPDTSKVKVTGNPKSEGGGK